MPESQRSLILTIFAVLLATALFLFYVWRDAARPASPVAEKADETTRSLTEFAPLPSPSRPGGLLDRSQAAPGFEPSSSKGSFYSSLAPPEASLSGEETVPDFLGVLFKTFQDAFVSPAPGPPLPSPPPSQITVTPQELFEFGYPPDYLQILRDFNQLMIDSGFLKAGEKYPLSSLEEVNLFQDKIAEFLMSLEVFADEEGVIPAPYTAEDAESFRKAYRETLPELWEKELRAEKMGGTSLFWPSKFLYAYEAASARSKSSAVLAVLKGNLISVAEASHVMSPQCYREGSPNLQRGSQRRPLEECCNCGYRLVCSRRRCFYVREEDCGHSGERCTIQTGCLNYSCPGLPAIWDPDSGICGCHI